VSTKPELEKATGGKKVENIPSGKHHGTWMQLWELRSAGHLGQGKPKVRICEWAVPRWSGEAGKGGPSTVSVNGNKAIFKTEER